MRTYLLDTSAILAHFFSEKGSAGVQALLDDPAAVILVAAPVLLELDSSLTRRGSGEASRYNVLNEYGTRLTETVSVDKAVVLSAVALRKSVPERLPAMDALIAGCALVHGAVLVHRDHHYDSIPREVLGTWNILRPGEYPDGASHPTVVREKSSMRAHSTRRRTA